MFSYDNLKKNTLKPLDLQMTFEQAFHVFETENVTYIPVVSENMFLGNLSLEDVETFDKKATIEKARSLFEPFFARTESSWFDILEVLIKYHTSICPILDEENNYIGYCTFNNILPFLEQIPFIKETGTTLIIEKNVHEYSISQISQIIEGNNAKLFGIIVSQIKDNKAQIILKTVSINIQEIIQTLRRFGYEIISEHLEDQFMTDLKDRSAYLDKYLNL